MNQKPTILSDVVKQNSNGRKQTLAELFKELVAGANQKKSTTAATTSSVKPERSKIEVQASNAASVRTNFQATEFFSRQGVSNLTARFLTNLKVYIMKHLLIFQYRLHSLLSLFEAECFLILRKSFDVITTVFSTHLKRDALHFDQIPKRLPCPGLMFLLLRH